MGDFEVSQHLKVLNGDRMAVVVIRNHFRCGTGRLALARGLHDGRPQVTYRRSRLQSSISQSLKRRAREDTGRVLKRLGVAVSDSTRTAHKAPKIVSLIRPIACLPSPCNHSLCG